MVAELEQSVIWSLCRDTDLVKQNSDSCKIIKSIFQQ
jgi:hypothetical protein